MVMCFCTRKHILINKIQLLMDLSLFIWLLAFDIGEIYDLKMNFLLLSST